MKKIIPALLLACVLFACKKDTNSEETPAAGSKVPVTFNISNFLVSQEDLNQNGRVETDISLNGFYKIFYMAFASDGTTASHIEQDSTNSKFGVISDSLLPGTYTIALGAHNRLGKYATYITSKYSDLATAEFYNTMARNTCDFFYKKLLITVSATGNPVITDVTLNRIVGNLKVDLKDALPASDPKGEVSVMVGGIPTSYMINTDNATNIYYSAIPLERASQTIWDYNIFGTNTPLAVTLGWKDKVTGNWQSKTISNVNLTANKRTIITGYLYGVPTNVSAGDVLIRTNQNWSTDSTVISIN